MVQNKLIRNKLVQVKLNELEKDLIKKASEINGITVTGFVRSVAVINSRKVLLENKEEAINHT